jgi:hypothetical protein
MSPTALTSYYGTPENTGTDPVDSELAGVEDTQMEYCFI